MLFRRMVKKVEITTKNFEELPTTNFLPRFIFGTIIEEEEIELHALRFILAFIPNIKDMQVHKNEQLLLDFDKEWNDFEKDNVMQVYGKFSNFLPKNYNNYEELKKALKYLSNIKKEFEDDKKYVQAELISHIEFIKNKGFSFVINKYWLKHFIDISHYINYDINSVFNLNSKKSLVMYLFINSFPFMGNAKAESLGFKINHSYSTRRGGKARLDVVKKMLNIKPDTMLSRIKANHIDPIRKHLNLKADVSFNYRIENDVFYFITYLPTNETIHEKTDIINKYNRFIDNRIKSYRLNDTEGMMFANKIVNYSLDFLNSATARKTALKGLEGQDFIEVFNQLINSKINVSVAKLYESNLSIEDKRLICKKYFPSKL